MADSPTTDTAKVINISAQAAKELESLARLTGSEPEIILKKAIQAFHDRVFGEHTCQHGTTCAGEADDL